MYGAAVIYVLNIGDIIFLPGMKPAVSPVVVVRKNKIDRNVLFVDTAFLLPLERHHISF